METQLETERPRDAHGYTIGSDLAARSKEKKPK